MIGRVSMAWGRARRVAAKAAAPRPGAMVPLVEAVGLVLAEPVLAQTPLPPVDVAADDGWAVSGPGPWTVEDLTADRLPDGAAVPVRTDEVIPAGADAVVPLPSAVLRRGKDVTWLSVGDAASGRPAGRPGHIPPGTEITGRGRSAAAGEVLVVPGRQVTPGVIAAAAAAGLDAVAVIRPPDVAVVTVGDDRWDHGASRDGRLRDVVSPALPGAITRAGGRVLPPLLLPGRTGTLAGQVRAHVEDTAADLVVLTGGPGPVGRQDCQEALSALGARSLVHDVAVAPGTEALLAELPDGRLVAYLPGDAGGAIGGLVTVVLPLLRAMAGRPEPNPVLALLDLAQPGAAEVTTLVPARRVLGELADTAAVVPGPAIAAFAAAEVLVVVPPGGAAAGQLVELVGVP
jgi:molybdopterin molybdotransferase